MFLAGNISATKTEGTRKIEAAGPAANNLELGANLPILMLPARISTHQALMIASSQEIVRSYRHIFRRGLYAVQYAAPARFTLKILLENAYRTGNAADFDAQKINNTLTFLEGAAKEKGLEHKILKNLLHTWYWEVNCAKKRMCVLSRYHGRALC